MPRSSKQLNRSFRIFTGIMLVAIGSFLAWYLYKQSRQLSHLSDSETTFKMYPGFGIPLPEGYEVHGIDVSRYQQSVNWPLVHNMREREVKLQFAFIKATEADYLVDVAFSRNWRKSREAGITRGAYHFFRFGVPAASQARLFINTVKLQPGDLPPVLDVEVFGGTDKEALQNEVQLWLQLIEQHYQLKPIIYTNASFYNRWLWPRFNEYPLWVAHYFERRQPRVNRNWQFWQHNESGRVNGIKSFVDFNVFNGSRADFEALLKR